MAIKAPIELVVAAFERQDYKAAAQLLKEWLPQFPDNPWLQLYSAKLQEVSGKLEAAEAAYRKLLQVTTNAKIALQARQGLQQLEATQKEQRQAAIAEAEADPSNAGLGFLILEPVKPEAKQAAIQQFARIMKLDPYTARIHLSHRSWKVYRTGPLAELQVYGQELLNAGLPVFWAPLSEVQKIRVFRVQHIQSASPQATVVCLNEADQLGALTFDWAEVSSRVEGTLPIFEDVIDVGAWNKLQRKEQTQDYAQVFDLHLPKRKCILRFCDASYQFQQGMIFDATQADGTRLTQTTNRLRWNNLAKFVGDRLSDVPTASDFTLFAETALEHFTFIRGFKSHMDIFRKRSTAWDPAFHLYSSLVFLQAPTVNSGLRDRGSETEN
ncbi:MAG TPA: tetratricopeptide repeat protein [Crinalium sp.]|jgi:tetratricopeptide (TPR) repeat protein